VTLHNDLNRVQGTIYSEELLKENIETLKTELIKQNIVDVRRISRMENGQPKDTPLHILTFDSNVLQETVKIGWISFHVRKYYPTPLRCSKCLVLGHTKKNCAETIEYCRGCALERHAGECTRKACRNCPNTTDHSSNEAACPKSAEQKAIIQIQTDKKIPYFKAKIEFRRRQQKAAQNAETDRQVQQQQEMYRQRTFAEVTGQQNDIQQQILRALEILNEKILKLENTRQPKAKKGHKKKTETNINLEDNSSEDSDTSIIENIATNETPNQFVHENTSQITHNTQQLDTTEKKNTTTTSNYQHTNETIKNDNNQLHFYQPPTNNHNYDNNYQKYTQYQQQQQKQLQNQQQEQMIIDDIKGIKRTIADTTHTTTTLMEPENLGKQKKITEN
jgi:hypothetical protein